MKQIQGSGQAVYRKAKRYIPGGTQLLTKRPEMFLPELWPSYYKKAKGVEVWDLDGRKFVDMSYCGIGACVLGFADPDVDEAVGKAIASGSMSTLNCPEEVELAELLCEIHPWASMVRYARCGGEAMAVAVRIARASTGRDKVAFCGYHGWHDWYLSANLSEKDALDGHLLPGLEPTGVPRALIGTAFPFRYNRIEELGSIASNHGDELAAIVMEPMRNHRPEPGFLEGVREIADKIGAVLIFDEITAGWRLNSGGAHLILGVDPDLAVFAKAISNGYPMAAVIGIEEIMQAAQKSFISSTYWTERIGPAAALATIRKHQDCHVPSHLIKIGERVQEGWKTAAEKADLPIRVTGMQPLAHFSIELEESQVKRTLFTQVMLQKGFLATNAFYATYAHNDLQVDDYLHTVEEAFSILAQAGGEKNSDKLLEGPVAHSGFMRLA
jgi:glutamate-1-semialdehyde 2,1-aminomutase